MESCCPALHPERDGHARLVRSMLSFPCGSKLGFCDVVRPALIAVNASGDCHHVDSKWLGLKDAGRPADDETSESTFEHERR